jgi:hypothetical protein
MNWKVCIIASVSALMVSFPQNIIGCGGESNPYDYYASFFHNNLPDAKGYKPFYYVSNYFLYADSEPASLSEVLAGEWAAYTGGQATTADAHKFVNKFAWKDLNNLYFNLEKNQPLKIPDSVKRNSMTDYFMRSKDLEALGYLMYAKKTEPFAVGDAWEPLNRDSLKMDKLVKNGRQLYSAAKKDIFKLKYAYQVLRMAHYSNRYADVINWYDEYSSSINSTSSVLQPLCLALKAGAHFRTGNQKEAAYLFSKVFSNTTAKRISNYLGFVWSISRSEDRNGYLSLCKNNNEKAAMLALFAMSSSENEGKAMEEIFALNPACEQLEVLATREVNKMEERYLTPLLQKQPGGKSFYGYWSDDNGDKLLQDNGDAVKGLAQFLHKAAQSGKTTNSGLFETGAAHTAYMHRDFADAKKYMAAAEKMNLTAKVKDQLMLTGLLVTISEKSTIDGAFEEQILPGLQWLEAKAKADKPEAAGYYEISPWSQFYRNLLTDVLAKRYHAQNDLQKEVLCIGAADNMQKNWYGGAVDFFRTKFTSKEVEKMFALMDSKNLNKFEKYLLGFNTIKKSTVTEFAGTAYLRDYNYAKAAEWFAKTTDKKTIAINTNPFVDLLYDQEERMPAEAKFSSSKLAFAQEMQQLQQLAVSDKANAAKHYYKYALGLYNMTYYGHAWKLVEYARSGSDGYYIPKDATSFQKEYYGCFAAQEYFEKAMNASSDKNVKARCLFMMAKCTQKQVKRPQYGDFTGTDSWDKYEAADKQYWPNFKYNKYFPQLVKEYGSTPFYKEAFSSCSYLRDFVRKK